jgi:RNA-directed DNA polymerase
VKANRGAGGVDRVDFDAFEKNKKNNLYKLWNRMASGSYFPKAVRGVEILKKNGKKRLLGIPTIEDRIAQMVVRMSFEPKVEKHTDSKWEILYIKRFLTASIQMPGGTIKERTSGTPQGGVISPVLANLFMHYAFDKWVSREYKNNPWVRYADDGLIHCNSEMEALNILEALINRMNECGLEIHPDKTKIVYCKSDRNNQSYENETFDFLGYTFRRRFVRSKYGHFFNGFTPAVSKDAGKSFRGKIKAIRMSNRGKSMHEIAKIMNPVIRGWANYFTKFCASEAKKSVNSQSNFHSSMPSGT